MSPATVLVVEDDNSMRLLCRVNLELEGYRVLEAERLSDARELIGSEPIDLILLDVHVRGEEGYELIGLAREKKIAIALMTGTARVGPRERSMVDAVVAKPFKLDILMETVRRLTSTRVG